MKWELFISWRYFTAKRRERFISLISLISILGIALGVMALIVVISVMNGFDKELRQRIVGVNPHIQIEKHGGIENSDELLAILNNTENVTGASPFINGQALFKADEAVTGVLLRGIAPATEVSEIEKYLLEGSMDLSDNDIIIGNELAKKFYLNLGDKVSVISPSEGKNFNFNVAGIFSSGMYEYDLNLVLTNIKSAQDIFNLQGLVGGIAVRLDSLYKASSMRQLLQRKLGYPYWVRDWMSMNRNLFSALKLEKTTMFVIVALIVVVACFNIAGSLIMVVMEKTKDIGILKAIGAANKAIKKIFIMEGAILGFLGTALGAASGLLLCWLLKTYKFIHLPRDIYYIESLPVQMRWMDSIVIVTAAVIIALLATVYPAHQAAKLNPADTLRYE
ncbi:MAG: lipoprotein-releasing ABC transporter permease subunit [Candidatus Omnitrophota bacterium]|nr:MAG: lipoprotein-releasing ABC transporter permease subunit [Candidatus Omnitrophota bacterium]